MNAQKKSLTYKVLCITGSVFLAAMGIFHGSGLVYVTEIMNASNAEDFLKSVIPVLFIHPSLHLLVMAVFGILALFFNETQKMLWLLSALIFVDAGLSFYLSAWLPGILVLAAGTCFLRASTIRRATEAT